MEKFIQEGYIAGGIFLFLIFPLGIISAYGNASIFGVDAEFIGYISPDPLPLSFSYYDKIKVVPYYFIYENFHPISQDLPVEGEEIVVWFKLIPKENINLNDTITTLAYLVDPQGNIKDNTIRQIKFGQGEYLSGKDYTGNQGLGVDSISSGTWEVRYMTLTETELKKFYNLSTSERTNYKGFDSYKIRIISKFEKRSQELLKFSIIAGLLVAIFSAFLGIMLSDRLARNREKKKRKEILKALVHEIEWNISFAESIKKDKKFKSKEKIPFNNFEMLTLEKVISENLIEKSNLLKDIIDYHSFLIMTNNFLNRLRQLDLPREIRDQEDVLEIIDKHIKEPKKMIKEIKKLL
ncbi:MAG: hypothetical protein Q7R52_02000 [archaeon]|nr:hypothetical protein [archaeon]